RERLARVAAVVDTVRTHAYLPVPDLVALAARTSGLDIEAAVSRPLESSALDALAHVSRDFAASAPHATLGAFLAWLDAAHSRERGLDTPVPEPDPGAVQVQTLHTAKGLEWDMVAVVGLVDG